MQEGTFIVARGEAIFLWFETRGVADARSFCALYESAVERDEWGPWRSAAKMKRVCEFYPMFGEQKGAGYRGFVFDLNVG
jgi:hypothetical protein